MSSPQRLQRPRGILSLPLEILHQIFSYFEKPQEIYTVATGSYVVENTEELHEKVQIENNRRQSIKAARLVCRLFNEVASPLLHVCLGLGLDQESVDFVEHLSTRPSLAKGLRHVSLWLDYWPRKLALDLRQFAMIHQGYFQQRCDLLRRLLSTPLNINPVSKQQLHFYEEVLEAWDAYFDTSNYNVMPRNLFSYQQCLLNGYENYQQRHREQSRLLAEGSFIQKITASLVRMPHFNSLLLSEFNRLSRDYSPSPGEEWCGIDWLGQYLRVPLRWERIEELHAELVPVKILVDLPVALHRAGVKLTELDPTGEGSRNASSWDDLSTSCRELKKFYFAPYEPGYIQGSIPLEVLSADTRATINTFVSAILSGQCLQSLHLDLLALDDSGPPRNNSDTFGEALATAQWSCLKRLMLSGLTINQEVLGKMCTALPDNLEQFAMRFINLKSGVWSGALDILRDKLAARCMQQSCEVDISGGEIGWQEVWEVNFAWAETHSRWLESWGFIGQKLITDQLFERYVSSAGVGKIR
ncbi:hypothetical protein ASPCAL04270 [Aspergillus calidoustus]|uniref:F-box domain-containing protein n=1 Tax=Aspergillus calidoustus TaxID=454130 RepID=A0A0U5C5F2_ASPCI|nr:hypothetical protein ASPCAL04270 [Aspergillus calidoustus]